MLGDNVRRRRLHVESLADRAERAERERDLLARERVAEERNRIARELHDIVAHSVSVMVIQAAAARRNVTSPTRTTPCCCWRTSSAPVARRWTSCGRCSACCGMPTRAAGGVPVPTLADLESLVDTHVGLPVRLTVTGGVDDVPAGVGLTAYRVVQEALTNATRHAGPGATVDVTVARSGGSASRCASRTTGAAPRRCGRARATRATGCSGCASG